MSVPSSPYSHYTLSSVRPRQGDLRRWRDTAGNDDLFPKSSSSPFFDGDKISFEGGGLTHYDFNLSQPFSVGIVLSMTPPDRSGTYARSPEIISDLADRFRFYLEKFQTTAQGYPSVRAGQEDQEFNYETTFVKKDMYILTVNEDQTDLHVNGKTLNSSVDIGSNGIQDLLLGGDFFFSDVFELVFYDHSLSTTEVSNLENHFKSEHGVVKDRSSPVARVEAFRQGEGSFTVVLDGSKSSDPNNKNLTYQWSFVEPSDNTPSFYSPSGSSTTTGSSVFFRPDPNDAIYYVELLVSNPSGDKDTEIISIDANEPSDFTINDDIISTDLVQDGKVSLNGSFLLDTVEDIVRKTEMVDFTTETTNDLTSGDELFFVYEDQTTMSDQFLYEVFQPITPQSSFTLSEFPSTSDTLNVWRNGQYMQDNGVDYSISGDDITMSSPVASGDFLSVQYKKSSPDWEKDRFTVSSSSDDTHTLSSTPASNSERVMLNGLILDRSDYSISNSTLTIGNSVSLSSQDILEVQYGTDSKTGKVFESLDITNNNDDLDRYTTNHTFIPESMNVYLNGLSLSEGEDYQLF